MWLVNMTGKANIWPVEPQLGRTLSIDRPLFPALDIHVTIGLDGPPIDVPTEWEYNFDNYFSHSFPQQKSLLS